MALRRLNNVKGFPETLSAERTHCGCFNLKGLSIGEQKKLFYRKKAADYENRG